jgi:hypothetical protein
MQETSDQAPLAFDPRPMMEIVAVRPLEGYSVWLQFSDGVERKVNLTPLLTPVGPMTEPLMRDPTTFRSVRAENGTIVWPNGFDLDPDVLYYEDLREPSQSAVERRSTANA